MSELTGQPWPSVRNVRETLRFRPLADASPADATTGKDDVGSAATDPMFEVMYLLDASESRVVTLRETLGSLGDSLVVAGHAGEWNVHVHVQDAGAAIDAGLAAGRVRRVSITSVEPITWRDPSLGSPHAHGHRAGQTSTITRRLVALVTGAGIGDLYEQAGATVIRRDRTGRPSISDVVSVLGGEHADEIVVLPNDGELVPLAEAAADTVRAHDRRIVVIPTVSDVPGMAALAVHDPTRAYDVDVVAMAAAAGRTRAGAIRTAIDGDVIGTVDGVVAVIGDDPVTVASDVVTRLLGPGGELVTIVVGSEAGHAVGSAVAASVEQDHPEVDVVIVLGEQPDPFLVVGVE